MIQFDSYFSDGLKPPTRSLLLLCVGLEGSQSSDRSFQHVASSRSNILHRRHPRQRRQQYLGKVWVLKDCQDTEKQII